MVGGAGTLVGLVLGIIIGRSTAPQSAVSDETALARAEGHLSERETPTEEIVEAPTLKDQYRRSLSHRLPRGFEATQFAKRAAGRLTDERTTLSFDIAPSGGSYAFSAVAAVDGAKTAKLKVELDDKVLGELAATDSWGMYSLAIPDGLLSAGAHELVFKKQSTGGNIIVESVAVLPTSPEVTLTMDSRRSVGSLIEGFATPERNFVWSNDKRSAIGVLLSEAKGNYRLTVRGSAISKLAPMTVTATVNGKNAGTGVFEKKVTDVVWTIPAASLAPGANRIEFAYPDTSTPSEGNPKSRDKRPLAVRFHQITLKPD